MSQFKCIQQPAHYIAGCWQPGRDTTVVDNLNPYDDTLLCSIQALDSDQLDEAMASVSRGRQIMADTLPAQRQRWMLQAADWLEARADALKQLIAEENGGAQVKAEAELGSTIGILREAASYPMRMNGETVASSIPGKQSTVIREPLGGVGVISPFNFPMNLSMRSVATALATGNSVLLKPDKRTFLTGGLIIAEAFEAVGLPADALNVVVGNSRMVGETMTSHPDIALVAFTGSTGVGQQLSVECARHFKHYSMELGGNNPFLVLDDADIEPAAEAAVFGSLLHQGQICMSINRIIVVGSLHDAFVESILDKARRIRHGDPRDANVTIGPLIDSAQADQVMDLIEDTVQAGAKRLLGTERHGNLISPTLLTEVSTDMPAAREEMFGPVMTVLRARDNAQALEMANMAGDTLAAAVFTSPERARRPIYRALRSGMVHFNDQTVNDESNTLFTGLGQSGSGQYNGRWGLESYTRQRWISDQQDEYRDWPF